MWETDAEDLQLLFFPNHNPLRKHPNQNSTVQHASPILFPKKTSLLTDSKLLSVNNGITGVLGTAKIIVLLPFRATKRLKKKEYKMGFEHPN